MKNGNSLFSILLLALMVLIGCNNDDGPVQPTNLNPEIESVTIRPALVEWGGVSDFWVTARDPEEQEMTYSWTVTGGQFVSATTANRVRWQAPNESGSFGITVTVSDGVNSVSQSDSVSVTANPVLSIPESTLRFDSVTDTLMFSVRNTRTGSLDWSITTETDDGGNWMNLVSDAEGTVIGGESSSLTVAIDRTDLSGGLYHGKIRATSNGGSDSVNVVVVVAEMEVSTESLDFGNELATLNFSISNIGEGTLYWHAEEFEDWMRIAPDSGLASIDPYVVSVAVDRNGIVGGVYNEPIIITSNGGSATIDVRMTAEPHLMVDPMYIEFGGDDTRLLTISNTGLGTMIWDVIEAEEWLNVSQDTGSTAMGESSQVVLTVDRTGMENGTHATDIIIDSNGGSEVVHLTMGVGPVIGLNSTTLDFDSTFAFKSIFVNNAGTGVMNWTLTEEEEWLTLDVTSGSSEGEADEVVASVDRENTAPGEYAGQIIADNGIGDETVINVTLIVTEGVAMIWDDGTADNRIRAGTPNIWAGVRFTRPDGWETVNIAAVQIFKDGGDHPFHIDALDGFQYDADQDIFFPPTGGTVSLAVSTNQEDGWHIHNIPENSMVSEHFFVGITFLNADEPLFGIDLTPPTHLRTGVRNTNGQITVFTDINFMLRIYAIPSEGGEGVWIDNSGVITNGDLQSVGSSSGRAVKSFSDLQDGTLLSK